MGKDNETFEELTINPELWTIICGVIPRAVDITGFPISFIDHSSEVGKLRFLDVPRYDRMVENETSITGNAYRSKIGKTLLKLLASVEPTPREIQLLVAKVKASRVVGNFLLRDDVENVYGMVKSSDSGNLGSSCMNGYSCVSFYDDFERCYSTSTPKVSAKVLTLTDNNGYLKGRAIIWYNLPHPVVDNETITFMDRVYVNDDNDFELFFQWATENKVWRKQTQSYSHKVQFILPDDSVHRYYFYLPVKNLEDMFDVAPYIDTLSYLGTRNGSVVMTNNEDYDDIADFHNTNGTACVHDGVTCYECGGYIHSGDVFTHPITREEYCESCYDEAMENVVTCDHCSASIWSDDSYGLNDEWLCEDCYTTATFQCDCCGETFSRDELDTTEDNFSLCETCSEDKTVKCNECGSIFYDEESLITHNGATMCKSCHNHNGTQFCRKCNAVYHNEHDLFCEACSEIMSQTRTVVCAICHNSIKILDANLSTTGDTVCSECVSNLNLNICETRGAFILPDHECLDGCYHSNTCRFHTT